MGTGTRTLEDHAFGCLSEPRSRSGWSYGRISERCSEACRGDRIRAAATSPAQLAQLELLVIMEELLKRTESFALVPGQQPTIAIYPASGFSAAGTCAATKTDRYFPLGVGQCAVALRCDLHRSTDILG